MLEKTRKKHKKEHFRIVAVDRDRFNFLFEESKVNF